MALLAPMPSARGRMATRVKAGDLARVRKAYLKSAIIPKIPNPKLQAPEKLQIPRYKKHRGDVPSVFGRFIHILAPPSDRLSWRGAPESSTPAGRCLLKRPSLLK